MDDGFTMAHTGFLTVDVETLLATEFPAREMVLWPLRFCCILVLPVWLGTSRGMTRQRQAARVCQWRMKFDSPAKMVPIGACTMLSVRARQRL